MIKEDADVNAKFEGVRAILMCAAQEAHAKIVKILANAGADVNAKDNDGCMALWWALNDETARILRRAGGKE